MAAMAFKDREVPSVRPGQLGQIVDAAAAAAGASGVGGPPSLIREAVTSQGQAQHLAWMAMAAVASEPQGEDGSPPPPSPPPLFFSTIFAPPPPGPPGSGVGRLHGWPRAPPAVTHEGPMTLVAWLAPRNPPPLQRPGRLAGVSGAGGPHPYKPIRCNCTHGV